MSWPEKTMFWKVVRLPPEHVVLGRITPRLLTLSTPELMVTEAPRLWMDDSELR